MVSGDGSPAAPERAAHAFGLDMLRGVAALGVLFFHCSSRFDVAALFPHGYLAVDFFFVLSGFVIARAYEARIASGALRVGPFLVMRAVRLMPLIVLGTLLAGVIELGRPGIVDRPAHLADTAYALLLGSVLVPILQTTTLQPIVFPLNGPAWSLFLEAIANVVFAVWAWSRLGIRGLVPIVGLSALALLWGVHRHGTIDLGSLPDTFPLGFARVGWSFIAGLVLYRLRERAPRVPFVVPAFLLVSIMVVPATAGLLNQVFDVVCVFVLLPWITWAASPVRFGAFGQRLSTWSGNLSYPIYALHYPMLRCFGVISSGLHLSMAGRLGVIAVATLAVLLVSACAYAWFDVPVRRWLARRLVSRRAGAGAGHARPGPAGDAPVPGQPA